MPKSKSQDDGPKESGAEMPAMPFNEALKRVWSAPPMHKTKPKPAKPIEKKPAK
jgi:hypothetical protein